MKSSPFCRSSPESFSKSASAVREPVIATWKPSWPFSGLHQVGERSDLVASHQERDHGRVAVLRDERLVVRGVVALCVCDDAELLPARADRQHLRPERGIVNRVRSERTTTISLGVGCGGKLSRMSADACFESGLLVTSPSLVKASPSRSAMTTKETKTATSHAASVRFGCVAQARARPSVEKVTGEADYAGCGAGSGVESGLSSGSRGDGSTRRMRAAQSGSHQFQRPRRATAAGARMPRMIVASIRMPPPSAVAKILASVPGVRAEGDEREAEDQRRARDEAAGAADALDDGGLGRAGAVVCLPHPADDEDLVVHRDAEEEGEDRRSASRR